MPASRAVLVLEVPLRLLEALDQLAVAAPRSQPLDREQAALAALQRGIDVLREELQGFEDRPTA